MPVDALPINPEAGTSLHACLLMPSDCASYELRALLMQHKAAYFAAAAMGFCVNLLANVVIQTASSPTLKVCPHARACLLLCCVNPNTETLDLKP